MKDGDYGLIGVPRRRIQCLTCKQRSPWGTWDEKRVEHLDWCWVGGAEVPDQKPGTFDYWRDLEEKEKNR